MASAGFLQLVVTAAFGSPYSPSAKPSRVGTRTFLPCNRHMILSISLPTAKRVVVSHHLVVAHAWHTTPETRLMLDV